MNNNSWFENFIKKSLGAIYCTKIKYYKLFWYNNYMSNYKRYFDSKSQVVFITFVTYQRQNILIENIEILRNAFEVSKSKYNFKIIAITIMKNHCHLLLQHKILPKNWEYSSFKNFVKNNYYDENWCNFNDKNDINSMDLE